MQKRSIACSMLLAVSVALAGCTQKQVSMRPTASLAAIPTIPRQDSPKDRKVEAETPLLRVAKRVQRRLQRRRETVPPTRSIISALEQAKQLSARQVEVTFTPVGSENVKPTVWTVAVREHPEWIYLENSWMGMGARVDGAAIREHVDAYTHASFQTPQSSTITAMETDGQEVLRVVTDGIAKAGVSFNSDAAGKEIESALTKGKSSVHIAGIAQSATVVLRTETGPKTLALLGTGRSNFEKSPAARAWNVRKALHERTHNVVIPAGTTFSFNATLGGPVTLGKGWKEALGIFGTSTAMTPGGGICQAATTVYRAALLAGLPIVKRKAHSLYVSYYEQYGVGVDATIFPGKQDLTFRNDTGDIIVLQSYTDGYDAYVNIFGIPDGRTVAMHGPYFSGLPEQPSTMHGLRNNEIGWIRQIITADGTIAEEPIVSRYQKGIPRVSLTKKYAEFRGTEALHAAAPSL